VTLLVLGGGFTGVTTAARARALGRAVFATTRDPARVSLLAAAGITPIVLPSGDAERAAAAAAAFAPVRGVRADVLVTFPPDGASDRAFATAVLAAGVRRVAYVSSTAVYGRASGRIDEDTPLAGPEDPASRAPRVALRLEAERIWAAGGATVVRAPGIYGPARGIHTRIAAGALGVVAPPAPNKVSRVHVDDLAAALLSVLASERPARGAYVVGDLEPAPHHEVVQWVCDAMGVPVPPVDANAAVDESLRGDRAIDAARLRAEFGVELAYPTYRAGYRQALAIAGLLVKTA
jgi:nucleoside-diphosphate-sugar epimerase